MNNLIEATLIKKKFFSNNLFSVFFSAKIENFIPGQYNRIIFINQNSEKIQRAYSYVNSPKEKIIEFYVALIPNGIITPHLFSLLPQQKINIYQQSFGFFTLKNIPICKHLWMFATGTAIGPYLSILQGEKKINQFNKIILIHAVKFEKDLNYLKLMLKLQKKYNNKLQIITILSREKKDGSLFGRIPKLLTEKKIEKKVDLKINKKDSHIMLCGNPNMVKETTKILNSIYNLNIHTQRNAGQITIEHYW
ncbi:ferredoxin--NADP(+) reductase [Buchnera aphidicola (Thelaxes californica)]|uniref:Flavodoxin/ferredoxin--NADP reductase n=1 Tax=Buchnera aphidicola (Thelaxes californica) TaxID=1315998 RepID=A0A4D6YMI2_9GAMM|nr:FAD-binding oxidoreductase [Buchnera aphidicola]QCI26968.1 ferredoxin--NADP(+) reductase [Buchnera aphidicola (Thelaxes californica)]